MNKINFKSLPLILLAVGIAIRVFISFNNSGFWSDELASIHFSKISVLDAITRDNGGPLFQMILRAWMSLFGESEHSIKALPLTISIVSLVIVSRRFSKIVLALMVFNPFSIIAATQIKSTALFELATVVFVYANYFELFKSELFFPKLKKLILFLILLVLTNYISLLLVMVILFLLLFKTIKHKSFYYNLILYFIFMAIALFVKEEVLSFMNLSFLRGFSMDTLLSANRFLNLKNDIDFYCFLSSFILAGLVFLMNKRLYSLSFVTLILVLMYLVFSQLLGLNLLITRYMTPLSVLSVLSIESLFTSSTTQAKKRFVLSFIGLLLIGFNYFHINRITSNSWKLAANELCSQSEKITVWGHDGLKYYFSDSCAKVTSSLTQIEKFCGQLVVSQIFKRHFTNNNSAYGEVEQIKVFGANSTEPVFLLNRSCVLRESPR